MELMLGGIQELSMKALHLLRRYGFQTEQDVQEYYEECGRNLIAFFEMQSMTKLIVREIAQHVLKMSNDEIDAQLSAYKPKKTVGQRAAMVEGDPRCEVVRLMAHVPQLNRLSEAQWFEAENLLTKTVEDLCKVYEKGAVSGAEKNVQPVREASADQRADGCE